jgi:DNA-binding transcriptional ArsR family regulator
MSGSDVGEAATVLNAGDLAEAADRASEFLKSLANPVRLRILCLICDREVDRGRARRTRPAAAVLGLRLGRRTGSGALRSRQCRCRARQRVLDLASGSGLVGIAAMKAGAKCCLCADIDGFALTAIALNAHANRTAVSVTGDDLLETQGDWDVILAGDIFYEQDTAARALTFAGRCRARRQRADRRSRPQLPAEGPARKAR